MNISFVLNDEHRTLDVSDPTITLLDWLRTKAHLCGTKESCNEGDCGACSVMVTDQAGTKALNACILFLPQLHGKTVRTIEGIASPSGDLHPVQQAMIDHHGSQCGFCTPGFVTTMAAAHLNGRTDFDDQLAGNLCRCTGYAPIVKAAEAASRAPVPDWIETALPMPATTGVAASNEAGWAMPTSSDALATWYAGHPEATLIAGATDVGLWVTKHLSELKSVAFLHLCEDLKTIDHSDHEITIGAAVTLDRIRELMATLHPTFAEMIRRYGSAQVRAAATIGGNIANGSPIGDTPPGLIALGATLHLRHGNERRSLPLENFFLSYGKQDRQPGEFVEAVSIPKQPDHLHVFKTSKRFDQDISAVCGAFNIVHDGRQISHARVAFGGMAATPKRAIQTEDALIGQSWSLETITNAQAALAQDYAPISDMRSSAAYRLQVAQGMLMRVWMQGKDTPTHVLEVRP